MTERRDGAVGPHEDNDNQVEIRAATERDVATLVEFNMALAWETEEKQLDARVVTSGVERLLGRPEAGFYLIAEREDAAIGALMVTSEWSDWRDGFFWWIQSVYVRAEDRRQGVFRSLYQHVQSAASEHPEVCGLRLYVENENRVAQSTYESLGMRRTPYLMYEQEF